MIRKNMLLRPVFAAALVMSLVACNNYDLLNQLESPGKNTNSTGGFISLYLFPASTSNGNLKGAFATGRAGADSICIAARSGYVFPNNGCNQVRAMVSLSSADSIANMPGNYGIPTNRGINAQNGFTLAPDWMTLISGTSGNALAPNVMSAATVWYSFSTTGGNYDGTNNCSGGTLGTSVNGATADSSVTGANWIGSSFQLCSSPAQILCICY